MIYFTTYLIGLVIGFFAGFIYTNFFKTNTKEEEYISLTQKGQDYLNNLNKSNLTK
jgi:uncharacterized membrane-anchored protein YhcB (DUF1043 family)